MAYYDEGSHFASADRHHGKGLDAMLAQLREASSRLSGLTAQVGSAVDSERLRRDISAQRDEGTRLVRDCMQIIKDNAGNPQYNSYLLDFQRVVADFRTAAENSTMRCKSFPLDETANGYQDQNSGREGGDLRGYVAQQQYEAIDLKLKAVSERAIDNTIIRERNQELRELNKEMDELADVVGDASRLIYEDSEVLSRAEKATDDTVAFAKKSTIDMSTSFKRAKASRRKLCCIGCSILCGMIIVVLIVVGAVCLAFCKYAAAA